MTQHTRERKEMDISPAWTKVHGRLTLAFIWSSLMPNADNVCQYTPNVRL